MFVDNYALLPIFYITYGSYIQLQLHTPMAQKLGRPHHKIHYCSPIFRIGGSSSSTFFNMTYSSLWLLNTSRDTQPSYIINPCNVPVFPPSLLHDPLLLQHPLLRICMLVGFFQSLRAPIVSIKVCIGTSQMSHAKKHVV